MSGNLLSFQTARKRNKIILAILIIKNLSYFNVEEANLKEKQPSKLKFSCSSSLTSQSGPELIVHFFQSGTRFNMLLAPKVILDYLKLFDYLRLPESETAIIVGIFIIEKMTIC